MRQFYDPAFAFGVVTSGGLGSYNRPGVVRSARARIGVVPDKKSQGREGEGCARTSLSGATLKQ